MAPPRHPSALRASVLDRLLDDAPQQPGDGAPSCMDLNGLKAALARDLEVLLNTRTQPIDDPEQYRLAARSVIAFGTPDLSGLSLLSADDREALRARVHRAIATHEPRLTQLRVALDLARGNERMLRFRVDAVLRAAPCNAAVCFDATLELSSNAYQVAR